MSYVFLICMFDCGFGGQEHTQFVKRVKKAYTLIYLANDGSY